MRGPDDDAIEEQLAGAGGASAADEAPPPAGGKALLRLLDLLTSVGLDDTARATLDLAVHPDARPAVQDSLARFAPLAGVAAGRAAGRRTRGARARAAATVAVAEDVAQASLDAA